MDYIASNDTNSSTDYIDTIVHEIDLDIYNDLKHIRYIISCISFILIIIGIITNLISSLAFSNKKYLSSTNI